MKSRSKITAAIAVTGGIILICILVFGTLLLGQAARRDTEEAVRSVSLLYLDELAGRREAVVEQNLNKKISDMQVAISLMTEEDLSDPEHLQAYQARMKKLYSTEKFAFVDSDGLIYTSLGTQDDIEDYGIDYRTISGPEISVKNPRSPEKKVIIAVPADRIPFGDKIFVASFMEIDMREMLEGASIESNNENATFCNIYTSDGIALSDTVLGGLSMEDNLLDALQRADFEAGYSYEKILEDFSEGRNGVVSFAYNGIDETLSYVPIDGTDWFLTYLVRESVISDEISSISGGTIFRSGIQTVLTAAVLLIMFGFIISQLRKNAKLTLEKEILEQEKQAVRQNNMITALSSDYRSVYFVDLDTDECICYQNDRLFDEAPAQGARLKYLESFREYARKYVKENYRESFLNFIEPDHIREELLKYPLITCRFLEDRNGTETYTMLRIAGVRHLDERDDNLVHAIGVGFTDIDAEMRQSMEQQQTLSDALAAAEQANRAKTVFLSNMSHEIRTPMNAIIGLDSLALHGSPLEDDTREYLEKIGESAKHLLGLINDILDMSRIESGRLMVRKEEFSFRDMLEQINTMVMSQCTEQGLKYECSVTGGVADYYIGDDMKLKQVLINILSNAIKFTDAPGSVSLSVERTAVFGDQSTIRFRISDTGIGMDPSFIPKIFDSFTQEDSSRNNKYGSTGLGMAITKNIVELMNGTISVESEKGAGSVFTVVITLKNCEHQGLSEKLVKPSDMKVLIVDDEKIAAEHARVILDEVGIAADTSLSGSEALNMLENAHAQHRPYNLVLLDWKMPEMDGIEVAKRIREQYDNETTVIILTSFNWDEIFEEALHSGVDSFLAKPLFASNVIDEFERIVRKNNMSLGGQKKRADLAGRRILLAEDILINAEIIKELIRVKGAQIDHAENGRIAVEMFRNSEPGRYDAVLMDVRMPELDGLGATMEIRALDRPDAKTVPVVALTANAFDEDVQLSLQAGMNAHLSKPVEPDHLYQTLEELIWEAGH